MNEVYLYLLHHVSVSSQPGCLYGIPDTSSDQFKCLERRQFVTFSDRTLISYINILYLNSPCFLMSECDEVDYIWAGLGWGRGDQIKRNYFTYAANIKIIQIYRPTSSPHFSHFYFPLQGNCKY